MSYNELLLGMDWNKEYLYHYTSFESAIKIIASKFLLFSDFRKVNDINESCGPNVLYTGFEKYEIEEMNILLDEYKQISLSEDKSIKRGFDIPAMWGHYACRGQDVCLVFDKKMFLSEIDTSFLYTHEITYSDLKDLNEILYSKHLGVSFEEFIKMKKDDIFFQKTKDWEYEQEYRVIAIGNEITSINISRSLDSVILFNREHDKFIQSPKFKALSSVGDNITIYRYAPKPYYSGDIFDIDNNGLRPETTYDFSSLFPQDID